MTNGIVATFYVLILVASIVTIYIYVDKWRKGQRTITRLAKEKATLEHAYEEVRALQLGTQLACMTLIQRFAPTCDDCGCSIDEETTVVGRDLTGVYVCCAECGRKNHLIGHRETMAKVDGEEHGLHTGFEAWENDES